jgi:hypothetical protein
MAEYNPGEMGRPSWRSAMVGVLPTLRNLAAGQKPARVSQRLLGYLAADLETQPAVLETTANLRSSNSSDEPSPSLQDFVLAAASQLDIEQRPTWHPHPNPITDLIGVLETASSGTKPVAEDLEWATELLRLVSSLAFDIELTPSSLR